MVAKRSVGDWVDVTYYGRGQVTLVRPGHYKYRVRFKDGNELHFHPNAVKDVQRVDPGPETL